MMTFEWMVARRYLQGGRGARRDRFLSVMTGIAVAAVAAGVTALVLALAINAGFREEFEERLLGAMAHVSLSRADARGIRDYLPLTEKLDALPGVRRASPALYETVLLSSGSRARGVVLKGLLPGRAPEQEQLFRRLRAGSTELARGENSPERLLVGWRLAEELGVTVGDSLLVTSPQGHLTPFGLLPRYHSFRVGGIFESGFWDFDAGWAYTDLATAQELLGLGDVVSLIELRLEDVYQARELGRAAESTGGANLVATPWMETHQSLFRALRLEKLVTALFIGLIVFVAGLNILVLLVMLVTQKRRDIALLLSFGARAAQVQRIFVFHGLAIGALGTMVGLTLGFGVALGGRRWQWFPLDPEVYGIAYVPFRVSWVDGLAIVLAALAISFAATLYPARRAVGVIPVEVLRYE
jgi:lipoprotein-releasing system permease protein